MLQRSTALVLATLVLTLPIGANAQIARKELRFQRPSDAGTSPYLSSVDSSLSGYIQGEDLGGIRSFLGFLHDLLQQVSTWRSGLAGDDLKKSAAQLRDHVELDRGLVDTLIELPGNRWLAKPDRKLREGFRQLASSAKKIVEHAGDKDPSSYIENFNELARDIRSAYLEGVSQTANLNLDLALATATKSGLSGFKLGTFLPTGSTASAFGTLTYSFGEQAATADANMRTAIFATASAITPLDSTGDSASGRVGLGLLAGDPDHVVSGLSVASYLTPSALDVEGSISLKVGEAQTGAARGMLELNDLEGSWNRDQWVANRGRHLADHVRPGDWWLSGNVRSLSSFNSIPASVALEGSLLYALRQRAYTNDKDQSPIAATTLELSGTYCTQRLLKVDEFGLELRTPIGGHGRNAWPIFASGRYGTRKDFTLAIEARL